MEPKMIERILKLAIDHRYFVVLLTIAIAAFGIYSLKNLPIDAVPDITNNQVQINTSVDGLSPTEVEKQVTFVIESSLAGIPGLESTRSISRSGFSQVTAIFDDKVNIYFARQQINERLNEAREIMPGGADPQMGPISTGLGEIYMWSVEFDEPHIVVHNGSPGFQKDDSYVTPEGHILKTDVEKASYLRTVQDWIIKPQMKGTHGVAGIDSIGGYVRQYHIEPNITKMLSLGLTFSDLVEAVKKNNLSVGAGYIEQGGEALLVKGDGRLESPDQIGSIVVTTRDGVPIYLRDLANVGIGKEMRTGSSSKNGHEVVIGTAMMLIGANSRTVSLAVAEKLSEINKSLPPGIIAKTIVNRTKLVDSTIHTVVKNLSEGAILVIAVLFLFLGNIRAALVTALVIPLSMLMTAIGMVETKISGNLMSLGAIDFGLIVDGAVIIAENCLRHFSEKQRSLGRKLNLSERITEVMTASKEMIQPSVFGQGIIITVYLPLLVLSGVEGKTFEPMALTVIFALIAAFILSMTFVPAMMALCITGKVEEKENKMIHYAKTGYAPLVEKSLKHPWLTIAAACVLVIGSFSLFYTLGEEFVPTLDEKDIAVQSTRTPSTSLTQATKMQIQVEKTLLKLPEVSFVFSKTGTAEKATDPMPPHASDTFVILKPKEEWPDPELSKADLIEKMDTELQKLPGNAFDFTQPIEMRFNELIAGVKSDVAIRVYGDNFEIMQKTASDIASVLKKIEGAADIKVDQTDGLPTLDVVINRKAINRYGLNVNDVLEIVSTAIGGEKAGYLMEGDRRFDIIVKLPDSLRQDYVALGNIPVPLPKSNSDSLKTPYIPLKEVADLKVSEGINEISRRNGKRLITVQANVRGTDIGTFVTKAKQKIKEEATIPPGYWIDWGGQFENLISARERLMIVVPACFALIFLLLFAAFNSFRHALLVFSGVPLALTGGIIALWMRDMPFSITAAVGFIALSGIAVLNGLVMVTYINQLMARGIGLEPAILQGALTRLRPVLVTALVASLGFVPMALATTAGAEVQKPLATVVIGGLISSTLLTLLVLPALYKLFAFRKEKVSATNLGSLTPVDG